MTKQGLKMSVETIRMSEPCERLPRVLLAEDDEEMRALLAQTLRKTGYEVVECSNGVHLLQELQNHLSSLSSSETTRKIDLVVSDIRMPFVSGLGVLRALQKRKRLPPVILITAFGDEETHAQARNLGAVSVFDKPFDVDDLLTKVCEIVPCRPDLRLERH